MPELPEVETIVRDLRRLATGARITEVEVVRPDLISGSPGHFTRALRGRTIDRIERRAKNILLHLQDGAADAEWLKINLGMTGRVLIAPASAAAPKHLGVRLGLADGRQLLYEDVRRFGNLEVLSEAEWQQAQERIGIEPLSGDFTPALLLELARHSRSPIKSWLMDQRHVVGIGNIYASEALFRARIHPARPARDLKPEEITQLHRAIRTVLEEAIAFRGTTLSDYRDAAGARGAFSERLCVYGREGEPCVRDGTPIQKIVQAGRSTFFCPTCQR